MKYIAQSEKGMARVARAVLSLAQNASSTRACIVGLSGELGAGKTTFTKAVAKELGVMRNVTSPTFVLERNYKTASRNTQWKRFHRLVHIDAYRLTRRDRLFAAHIADLLRDPKNLILIEWVEHIKTLLPKKIIPLTFFVVSKNVRAIVIK